MRILLQGIVGSTAYGLNHAGSDIDRLGVFAAPTTEFHGLRLPIDKAATIVEHDPDSTLHEVRKYCLLAMSANPTAIELMWLPGELYDVRTEAGSELIALRGAFLSAERVRDAYLGYASQQFTRLVNKGSGEVPRARVAKHARHLARLAHQGRDLYATGQLNVRLANPQWYREFGETVASEPAAASALLADVTAEFDAITSPLPAEPDERVINDWLLRVRADGN